jgi:hypothetical protein
LLPLPPLMLCRSICGEGISSMPAPGSAAMPSADRGREV